ncbi:hypothetical protein [Acetobacter persici]|uniref:Uncharacterized protein n=1 Tax=Acetobacter persici TaxID=1076596 RepID=A0A1U9LJT6_9PROT|nr:hypothetical protein [Acetobacter persici]AQT06724.1 hypothetical protein A0U91_17120 [Acetobacter persici]
MTIFYHADFFDADGRLSHNAIATLDQAVEIAQGRRIAIGQDVPAHEVANLTMEERGLPGMDDDYPNGMPDIPAHIASLDLNGYEFATYKKWLENHALPGQAERVASADGDVVMFDPVDDADGWLLRAGSVEECVVEARNSGILPHIEPASSPTVK